MKDPSLDTKIGEELLPRTEDDKIEAMLHDLKVLLNLYIILCRPFLIDVHMIYSYLFIALIYFPI